MKKQYCILTISCLLIGLAGYGLYHHIEKTREVSQISLEEDKKILEDELILQHSGEKFPQLMPRNSFHINSGFQTPEFIKQQKEIQIPNVRFPLDEENPELLSKYKKLKRAGKCRILEDCADPGGGECWVCGPLKGYELSYTIPSFGLKLRARNTENSLGIVERGWYKIMDKEDAFLFSGNAIYDRYKFNGYPAESNAGATNNEQDSAGAVLFYYENTENLPAREWIRQTFPYFGEDLISFDCKERGIIGEDISCYMTDFIVYEGAKFANNYLPIIIFNNKGTNAFIYYDGGRTDSFEKMEITLPEK